MRGHMKRRQQAFTLVELLVVIGIIALLISILLPALSKAMANGRKVKCQANMRSIGQALFAYANDNQGILPPAIIDNDGKVSKYPDGEYWANLLVRGKYVSAPNAVNSSPSETSVFRCPDGIDEIMDPTGYEWHKGGDHAMTPPDEPHTSRRNFQYFYPFTNGSGKETPIRGLAVRTWYQLNAGNQSYLPFRWVRSDKDLNNVKKIARMKRASEMVIMTEGTGVNQFWRPVRIAGRHGEFTQNGTHAYTNILFFDCHVGYYETTRFLQDEFLEIRNETIFRLDYAN